MHLPILRFNSITTSCSVPILHTPSHQSWKNQIALLMSHTVIVIFCVFLCQWDSLRAGTISYLSLYCHCPAWWQIHSRYLVNIWWIYDSSHTNGYIFSLYPTGRIFLLLHKRKWEENPSQNTALNSKLIWQCIFP